MKYAIGIDLGGTNIKAVAISPAGEILERRTSETNDAASTIHDWSASVRDVVENFAQTQQAPPLAIGMATPGLASLDSRTTAFCPGKLEGLVGFDWTNFLRAEK